MPEQPEAWGPRLAAYLDAHLHALGTNPNAWADKHPGVSGANITRWRKGEVTPRLPAMRAVADALGVSLVDVLVAAGAVDEDEAGGREVAAPPPPDIDAAIQYDPELLDWQRRSLREILDAMRKVSSGQPVASGRVATPGKAKPTKRTATGRARPAHT